MNQYKTSDLFLSTHLLLSGIRLEAIERIDSKRAEFIFEKADEEIFNSYFEETKEFPTRRVLNELKNLKSRIYSTPIK